MSFWIELHCDKRTSTKCWTHTGETFGELSCNTQTSRERVKNILVTEAKLLGWKQVAGEYICPECLK